jgi:hypothetical protein
VSVPPPGSGAPTDSVRFFDGTTWLGTTPVNSGVAVLLLSTSRLGDRALTAAYKGDGTLFGSISNVVAQRVVNHSSCVASSPNAWWRGEGNATDASGAHNGALQGGVTFAAGKVGQAFSLDGVSGYVSVPNDAAFNFANAITIDAWVKPADGNDRYVVTKAEDSFYLAVGPTVLNKLSFWLNGVSTDWLVGTTDVADNQWHHVAGTYDGSFMRIYVDGHLENSVARSGTISTGSSPVLIGYRPSPTGHYPGLIDELAIYNRALSAFEIQNIFENGAAGRCALVAVGDAPPPPFAFSSPWPNPSERGTNIEFQLPAHATVRVEVVDVAGRRVSLLMDRGLDAGRHWMRWDGRDMAGNRVAPGVYLIRVSTGAAAATRKIVEIR